MSKSDLTIVYPVMHGPGWHPVTALAELAAELLDAKLIRVRADGFERHASRVTAALPRRRGRGKCVVIASQPRQLFGLLQSPYLLTGYEHVAAWVIDSFWHERIPDGWALRRHYDQIFVTDPDDAPVWSSRLGLPTSVLPWGADVLRLGSHQGSRPIDLQRVGRQPAGWDQDEHTTTLLDEIGVSFGGRPSMHDSAAENQRHLAHTFSRSKFVLAFSNLAHSAGYTHSEREYITARWTDALAAGAVVCGIAPQSAAAKMLLWPGAALELPSVQPDREALTLLADAVRNWTPEVALRNHQMARKHLDWRWRLNDLIKEIDHQAPRLQNELVRL